MRVWMLVLVVVGIFGLGVLLFPMYARVEEHIPARCISNIDEIVKALIMYTNPIEPPQLPRAPESVRGGSYPDSWPEIYALDDWDPVRYAVTADGLQERSSYWRDSFGWFCYGAFVDPGLMWSPSNKGTVIYWHPLSAELHDRFSVLKAACTGDPALGGALKLLFENVGAFARPLPDWGVGREVRPLSTVQRAPSVKVAETMRRVMANHATKPEVKAAAHLIAALTEGNESRRDTASTRELAVIPGLYPKQPLTGFLSQYYRYCVLAWRGEGTKARRVAAVAVKRYSKYSALRDLGAYLELKDVTGG